MSLAQKTPTECASHAKTKAIISQIQPQWFSGFRGSGRQKHARSRNRIPETGRQSADLRNRGRTWGNLTSYHRCALVLRLDSHLCKRGAGADVWRSIGGGQVRRGEVSETQFGWTGKLGLVEYDRIGATVMQRRSGDQEWQCYVKNTRGCDQSFEVEVLAILWGPTAV